MLVLGIEAATPVAAVALVKGDKLLSERLINNRKTHSVNLAPIIKSVLEDAEVKPADLDGIAVSSGPGSFTGLRIGMSTAKALAHVLDIPITGVSTLEALASRYFINNQLVCPILNARKAEVYMALYQGNECLNGPLALSVEELCKVLNQYEKEVIMLGDGVPVYREELAQLMGDRVRFAPYSSLLPGGAEIAFIGSHRIATGNYATSVFELLPTYVRLPEAEIKWLEKQDCCQAKEANR